MSIKAELAAVRSAIDRRRDQRRPRWQSGDSETYSVSCDHLQQPRSTTHSARHAPDFPTVSTCELLTASFVVRRSSFVAATRRDSTRRDATHPNRRPIGAITSALRRVCEPIVSTGLDSTDTPFSATAGGQHCMVAVAL
jgi:hypothetical protein